MGSADVFGDGAILGEFDGSSCFLGDGRFVILGGERYGGGFVGGGVGAVAEGGEGDGGGIELEDFGLGEDDRGFLGGVEQTFFLFVESGDERGGDEGIEGGGESADLEIVDGGLGGFFSGDEGVCEPRVRIF